MEQQKHYSWELRTCYSPSPRNTHYLLSRMWAVAVLASQTRAPRWAPETSSGQTQRQDTGRTQVTRRVRVISLMISSLCRIRSERSRERRVGQPDRVPAVLPQLRRGSGQHLAVSISVLQKWWRSANCQLDTCHVMCYCHLLGLSYSFNRNVKLSFCLVYWHLATTNTFFWIFISLTYE